MYRKISYFPGLNALRFLAAYLVVLHHSETIRIKYSLYQTPHLSLFTNGGNGVSFFFVLSGFLITYLLLREDYQNGTISIKKFYVRRMLRIWPLYFLLVAIGLGFLPSLLHLLKVPYEAHYTALHALPWYLFFMPFMVNILYGTGFLNPLWSIGVEEFFYAIWAPLFKLLRKHITSIVLIILIVKTLLLTLFYFVDKSGLAYKILDKLSFECMSIGALGAIFVYHRKVKIENALVFRLPLQLILLGVIIAELVTHQFLCQHSVVWNFLFNTPILSRIILAVLFCWIIVNIAVNTNSVLKLKSKILDYLGRISYGIYMYQMCVIFGVEPFLKKLPFISSSYLKFFIFNFVVIILLILVAALSKRYFEDYFLKLKQKFEA